MNKRQKKKQYYKEFSPFPFNYKKNKKLSRFLANNRSSKYGRWRTKDKVNFKIILSYRRKVERF